VLGGIVIIVAIAWAGFGRTAATVDTVIVTATFPAIGGKVEVTVVIVVAETGVGVMGGAEVGTTGDNAFGEIGDRVAGNGLVVASTIRVGAFVAGSVVEEDGVVIGRAVLLSITVEEGGGL
jgi:hypothetical protein